MRVLVTNAAACMMMNQINKYAVRHLSWGALPLAIAPDPSHRLLFSFSSVYAA